MKLLSASEVEKITASLTEEQREFLTENIKQRKKDKWLQELAKYKGIKTDTVLSAEELESLIDDWVLIEILDCGFGNRDYRCLCGTPLRFQYVVLNKQEGKQYGLGSTCFEHHTNIPSYVVKDILNGFEQINLERDDILLKYKQGKRFDILPYVKVEGIPPVIIQQLQIGLPLSNKQMGTLEKLKKEHDEKQRIAYLMNRLTPQAKDFFHSLPTKYQTELLQKMSTESYHHQLPDGFQDKEIERYMELGLPLLDKQMERIFAYNRANQRNREEARKTRLDEMYESIIRSTTLSTEPQPTHYLRDTEEKITYQMLLDRHLPILQEIGKNEHRLPSGLKERWGNLRKKVLVLKDGGEFDYSSFKVTLENIRHSLGIK